MIKNLKVSPISYKSSIFFWNAQNNLNDHSIFSLIDPSIFSPIEFLLVILNVYILRWSTAAVNVPMWSSGRSSTANTNHCLYPLNASSARYSFECRQLLSDGKNNLVSDTAFEIHVPLENNLTSKWQFFTFFI